MSRENAPLLGRGEYDSAGAYSSKVGAEVMFEDIDYSASTSGVRTRLTGHRVRCRLVKNSSGIALLPGRVAVFKAGTSQTEVDGMVATTGKSPAGVIDEYLPSAGVPDGSYFWLVMEGPCSPLTSLAGDATNVITEGNPVVALTAATSQATTAGRVAEISTFAASTHLGSELLGVLGRALSSRTTAQTNAAVRVYLRGVGW